MQNLQRPWAQLSGRSRSNRLLRMFVLKRNEDMTAKDAAESTESPVRITATEAAGLLRTEAMKRLLRKLALWDRDLIEKYLGDSKSHRDKQQKG